MPISFNRYVDITSGVGAGQGIKTRDLILRIFTNNPLLPPTNVIEFEELSEVEAFFGSLSEEYLRASPYFSFVGKLIGSPDKISFSRWANVAAAPIAYSDPSVASTLGQFQTITAGTFSVELDGVTVTASAVNLSAATSLANVATLVQAAIRAAGSSQGTGFTAMTVAYQAAANGIPAEFVVTGGQTGSAAGAISFPTTNNTIGAAMGFLGAGVVSGAGADVETLTETLTNSVQTSNNFLSYVFLNSLNLTSNQVLEIAEWNAAQNVDFMFLVPVTATEASIFSPLIMGLEGCGLTLAPLNSQFPEQVPAEVAASIDFSKPNQAQNFMYQTDGSLTPSVTNDTDANTYDALNVNYYGQTQINGQTLSFYQRGFLTGPATAPQDMGIYVNEAWFKNAMAVQLLQMQLDLPEVPIDATGKGIITSNLLAIIAQATANGVIRVGKTLTLAQQQYITEASGSNVAWQQVQNLGYWLNVTFSSIVNSAGITEWQANYTVLYSKNDVVRKIVGTHVLI